MRKLHFNGAISQEKAYYNGKDITEIREAIKELETLQYPVSNTGHTLNWYNRAETFYNENKKEINKYFNNLCNEYNTSGANLINMSVTEILNTPDIAKYKIIEGYLQSLIDEILNQEVELDKVS